ncbi:hypothetical protein EA462_08195 [Natrarchaeobius halalkaliphilus]|uniref:Right-handed parallel beta-helix repeat-containing protein n=1 Tax=Natrarchaeobius halalkaliphilus TaxID=1679091 RepID=A0A3N6LPC3_9EURY|nr:hypothetical protein [Natrarchaeobius halalkaliphilus]RQG89977.1 hypothetical protein EA462_08195 [Natrarchaeobius halalkaliphilus]
MNDLQKGTDLRRRTVLLGSGLAVAGFAGCLDDEPEGNGENDGKSDGGNDGGDENGGESDDDSEDETNDDEQTEDDGPQPPEPDFLVGSSQDADYETLQEAYDSLQSGDVIGIEPGTYTLQQSVDSAEVDGEILTRSYTYVGESPDETTIEILVPDEPSFIVQGLVHYDPEDGAPEFWNVALEIPADLEYARTEDEDAYEDGEAQINAHFCTVEGTLGGPTAAHGTVFMDDLSHEISPTDCRFHGEVGGRSIAGRECRFDGDLKSRNGYVLDSVIDGTVNLNSVLLRRCEIRRGINVNGGGRVEDCLVEPKPDSNLAIDIRSEYAATVTGSEIRGTVRSNQDGSHIDRFELNRFDVPGARYIIDGAPATDIYLNAFVGGDVRITTDTGDLASFPAEELDVYDPERELGNYYSEWDETSDADEGILGTRTLPGEDGAMDRHPLATPDVEAYAKAATEADEDD